MKTMKLQLSALVLAACIALPISASSQSKVELDNYLREKIAFEKLTRVDSLMKSGKMVDARQVLLEVTKLDPNSYSNESHALLAETCYFLGNFQEAVKEYDIAIKYGGKDWRLFWNAALCNMHLNNYKNALVKANQALKSNIPEDAKPQIQRFVKEMSEKAAENPGNFAPANIHRSDYFDLLLAGRELNVWDNEKLPLKVYVKEGTDLAGRPLNLYRKEYPALIYSCLDIWSKASGGKLSFLPVNDANSADMLIAFSQTPQDVTQVKGEIPVEQGITRFHLSKDDSPAPSPFRRILKAQVELLLVKPTSLKALTVDEMKQISLHELGHALGIRGHSDSASDIMYFNQSFRQLPALTKRDKATIARLYSDYPGLEASGVLGFNLAPLGQNQEDRDSAKYKPDIGRQSGF
ncbi:MAG: matrixin family metalloprotease [Candidatus Obscuribacterales bacterium]|nr:matrixin family metalloprotease [Candidatus Obscuribacterales bacterium]